MADTKPTVIVKRKHAWFRGQRNPYSKYRKVCNDAAHARNYSRALIKDESVVKLTVRLHDEANTTWVWLRGKGWTDWTEKS
jgi:hypothetical protein